ncbi:MAG: thymidylate synthase [Candidatus Woesearchaeota archaeon]
MGIDTSKLNKHDAVYHQLTYDILTSPRLNFRKADRVVIDTMGVFGNQVEYDLSDETIPLSNTKNIGYKTQLFPEVVGFMRNENNLKWYLDQGMSIWTANAFNFYREKLDDAHEWKHLKKDSPEFRKALGEFKELVLSGEDPDAGYLGNFYPRQWRSFKGVDENSKDNDITYVDQLQDMIDKLIEHPTGRYALVTAWNPFDVKYKTAALAPCHVLFQGYRYEDTEGVERLDMKMYQRSADHHLGVAFNGPQYSAVTSTIAKLVGVKPGRFIHTFGDLHLYIGRGERSQWYKDKKNLSWLQKELKTKQPYDALDNLLRELPSEGEYPGYDHVPYAIKQLGMESNAEPAKLYVHAKDLNTIKVSDLQVQGYKRPPKLEINGVRPQMAS